MALTKSRAQVDEWASIAQNAVREGAVVSSTDSYSAMLHIEVGISSVTAHTGTKIAVMVSGATDGDEDWTTLTEFIGPTGTAALTVFDAAEAGGQTVLSVAGTTGFETDETSWIFLEDTTEVAKSELALLVDFVNNDTITVLDGITNAKTTDSQAFSIADNYVVELPMSTYRARVVYDNTFDSNGATVHTRTSISKVTSI